MLGLKRLQGDVPVALTVGDFFRQAPTDAHDLRRVRKHMDEGWIGIYTVQLKCAVHMEATTIATQLKCLQLPDVRVQLCF